MLFGDIAAFLLVLIVNYLFKVKNILSNEKTKDKVTESDRETLTSKIEEVTTWLDEHPEEEKETYENIRKATKNY